MTDHASRYELVDEEFGRCKKCGRLADVVCLKSLLGDQRIATSWAKCGDCSNPEFRLPQSREEAFGWWKSRKARRDVMRAKQGSGTPRAFRIENKTVPCKTCGAASLNVVLRPKAAFGKPVSGWFKCPSCSRPDYELPATVDEAYDRWQKKLAKREANPSSYELVEESAPCRQCRDQATVFRLRPKGGGRSVASWFLCDSCSPAEFYPPETAKEAYDRWQKRQARRFGGKVVDVFTPAAA